jgi:TonB-linked SusC/RagA family outer membrane protein
VVNENGEPVQATVTVKGTSKGTSTNQNGEFQLTGVDENAVLVITGVGIEERELKVAGQRNLSVVVKIAIKALDEVQMIAYGTTTKRLNTGNVSTVKASEIERQPVSNPIATLEGRVSGMFIQSNSGLPGANLNIQIRGLNSIAAGTSPLYVIDGVPYTGTSLDLLSKSASSPFGSAGTNPLNSINPADVESIDILKDADATAIYGSRAANGVVLITTKKGKAGKTKLGLNFYSGIGEVGHFIDMLDIQQYIQLRRMAFSNSAVTPTTVNAPDLLVWDTTQNTNWQKKLIGNTAPIYDAQLSVSGGDLKTKFRLGGSYRHEGSVFPGNAADNRATSNLNVEHYAFNNKFHANVYVNYSIEHNNLNADITSLVNLPPDYPIYDSLGKVIWRPNSFSEPYASLLQTFNTETKALINNLSVDYILLTNFTLKANLGYTQTDVEQIKKTPVSSQSPVFNPSPYAYFADNHSGTWLIEPQANYNVKIGKGKLDLLLGSTFQETKTKGETILGTNYSSDIYLDNIALAGTIQFLNNNIVNYTYNSVFGRLNFNLDNKYILNGTFRRDGSSRFGPGKQFGNFGSIGGAWIFSDEKYLQNSLSFLSYGKLHGSYGITGNDQITDYQYMSTYIATTQPYLVPGIRPSRLANLNYSWETNKKLEVGIDLGFIKDRILLSVVCYQNRSGNQLINYPLPAQTGFITYQANLPAKVQNTGYEVVLNTTNVKSKNLNWTSSYNLTIPRNKLLSFPGIELSSYGINNLIVGQPLNLIWGYQYLGANSQTGLAQVADLDNNGVFSSTGDYYNIGSALPKYYGGMDQTVTLKRFQISILVQFAKKIASSLSNGWYTSAPGTIYNQEASIWNDVWKKSGDESLLPKPLLNPLPYYYALSDKGAIEDASYIKLKNVIVSYNPLNNVGKNKGLESLRIFVQGQNLFTITKYKGFDPEASSPVALPNLRIITAGIHLEF